MRSKQGIVISKSGKKTIVVKVETSRQHPKYKKRFMVSAKFHVHDEKNAHKVGDKVIIYETRPLSRLKRWTVTEEPSPQQSEGHAEAEGGSASIKKFPKLGFHLNL